jgi:hypothetical protein
VILVNCSGKLISVKLLWIRSLRVALVATLLYAAALESVGFRFPLIADDYIFAAASYRPDFSLGSFWYLLVKRPVASFFNFWAFRFHISEHSNLLFYIYFFLNAWGLGVLIRRFSQDRFLDERALSVITFILSFYPCFHESLGMALNLPYSLGCIFLAIAAASSRPVFEVLSYLLAMGTLETYVLPAFLLAAFKHRRFSALSRPMPPNFGPALEVDRRIVLSSSKRKTFIPQPYVFLEPHGLRVGIGCRENDLRSLGRHGDRSFHRWFRLVTFRELALETVGAKVSSHSPVSSSITCSWAVVSTCVHV